jgi:NADPH-dependent ferric siderophore reductase
MFDTTERHAISRVRHDTRRRTLTVARVARLTPKMLRIGFTSPELADFESAAPDDHVKLFLPAGPGGEGCMRDYTPRAFDRAARTLTIDFALHEAGPATAWALNAQVGDRLEIGGPRGSTIVPNDFDWQLLIADETGLPAIGRRLEELAAGAPVTTVVLVDDMAEAQAIETTADWTANWVCRDREPGDDAERLLRAVRTLAVPPGDGFVWIAAEATVARSLRTYFLEERKHPPRWMRASGYWSRGQSGAHEKFD